VHKKVDNVEASPQTSKYINSKGFKTLTCIFVKGMAWLLASWQSEQIELFLFWIDKEVALLITGNEACPRQRCHMWEDTNTRESLWLKMS